MLFIRFLELFHRQLVELLLKLLDQMLPIRILLLTPFHR